MKNVFLGEYVKQRRLDLGLTQEQLCDGICEPMTLSRLENGKQTPSRNRINALLQRLGLPDDRYFALLSKNELEMEALQKEIVACNVTEKVPEGFEKLAQFEKLADPDDQIAQQFALRSRVLLGRLKLNLREHKQTHSYCWSTSSSSNVFYVDMNLKTYRCTCTVGRSRYSLFDFSYENLTNYRPVAVTCNSYAECKDCKIGGFCGGGCQLSHQIDFKKCCTYEEEVFSHFMKTLFIPYIKSKYNEVNQNERKAENRCT